MTPTRQPEMPAATPGTPVLGEGSPDLDEPDQVARLAGEDEPVIGSENYIG